MRYEAFLLPYPLNSNQRCHGVSAQAPGTLLRPTKGVPTAHQGTDKRLPYPSSGPQAHVPACYAPERSWLLLDAPERSWALVVNAENCLDLVLRILCLGQNLEEAACKSNKPKSRTSCALVLESVPPSQLLR